VTNAAEFLVRSKVRRPQGVSDEHWAGLLEDEYAYARDLLAAGTIVGIWRIPGALENIAIWRTRDATHLHELLTERPLHPWADVVVTALATHPVHRPTED
jgi:muconolactone D-isomerase